MASPLLTIFEAPPEARIFAINHVGLDGTALVAGSQSDLRSAADEADPRRALRHAAAEAARDAVERHAHAAGLA